jgi:short-subunit dehydrogenase
MDSPVTSFRQIDLGDRQAPRSLCGELIQEDPPINVLVSNAGIFTANAAEVFEPDLFWNILAVNLYAPTALAIALGRRMCERAWGSHRERNERPGDRWRSRRARLWCKQGRSI